MISKIILLVGGYLLGSIPFGVMIARGFYHTDIRQLGSRNTGATNVWRVLGKKPGIATLALDIAKGVAPVLVARRFFPMEPVWIMGAGLAAIVGHNWSIFLMGSGGKGVATSAGVFLALIPLQGTLAIATFLTFFLTSRHVSVGSMAAAVALLIATWALPAPTPFRILVLIASAIVLIKHIPNIKRLSRGEEPKVNFR